MEEQEILLTPDDTYSVAAIEYMRNNIRDVVYKRSDIKKYIDLEIDDGVWSLDTEDIVEALTPVFASAIGVGEGVVHQSLHSLLRGNANVPAVAAAAWIMSGNQQRLKAGEPIDTFINVVHDEWVPVLVTDYSRCKRRGKVGGEYTLKVLGGSPTTCNFKKFFTSGSRSSTLSLLKRLFGLSYRAKNIAYEHIVGMRAWVYLDATKSQEDGRPFFDRIECNSAFENWNKKLMRNRKQSCIQYPELTAWNCVSCGYGLSACSLATHLRNREVKTCTVCGKPGFFEKEQASTRCMACSERRRLARR